MVDLVFESERFSVEHGLRVSVQVPETHASKVANAIVESAGLQYGDYDSVLFKTSVGVQQFRSLGNGRNPASDGVISIPCIELSFFLPNDQDTAVRVLEQIYFIHPYEEPVISVQAVLRTIHRPGIDEENSNRIWNETGVDWYPDAHK